MGNIVRTKTEKITRIQADIPQQKEGYSRLTSVFKLHKVHDRLMERVT